MPDVPRPIFENKAIPRERKSYLGDGLYACHDGFYLWLEAYNGIAVSDRVGLDDMVLDNLSRFVELLKGEKRDG